MSGINPSDQPARVAIAVVAHQGQFLVGVRTAGRPLAGLAEFPGGKVQDGEDLASAAVRECQEETGLSVQVIQEYLSTVHRYEHGLLEIHFFQCQIIGAGMSAETPHPPFRWMRADELATLDFPAANSALLRLLLRDCR